MMCIVFTLTASLAFWEDFTCLDVSQCILNKAILQVAVKYLESDISGCLSQFLSLGSKVYMSSVIFFYLFLYLCTFTNACISVS
jgi:hypothetical protein